MLTVLVRVRDDELFVERCIRSVLDADGSVEVEVHTVEAPATDDAPLVLTELASAFPGRLHRHAAWAPALAAARGRWVCSLDADQALLPGAVELLMRPPEDGAWLFGLTRLGDELRPGPASTFFPREAGAHLALRAASPLGWLAPSLPIRSAPGS